MPVRSIIKWPDPKLSQISNPIEEVNLETISLAKDLYDTMIAALGIGLAAPQVGISKALCVIKNGLYESPMPVDPVLSEVLVLVNPLIEILDEKETFQWREACLSVDNTEAVVTRYKQIKLSYTDLGNNKHSFLLYDHMAGVIQHETDHLIGKVFIDRLPPKKYREAKSKILSRKREEARLYAKLLKKQKREEALERAQNEEPPRAGFRALPKEKSAQHRLKKRKISKNFGKNKHRRKK